MKRRRSPGQGPRVTAAPRRVPAHMKEYKYSPLLTERSMRVLQLQPGTDDDRIWCRLETVGSDSAPPYEAISYAWGSQKMSALIFCGNGKLRVPLSLRDALFRLRSNVDIKTFWADAICINQDDENEKGHQVKIMGNIFSGAVRVLVWLGNDPFGGPSEYGLDEHPAEDEEKKERQLDDVIAETKEKLDRLMIDLDSWMQMSGSDDLDYLEYHFDQAWMAWVKLMSRPWFSRLWVVQEVGLAKSAIALVGDAAIDLTVLLNYAATLAKYPFMRSYFGFDDAAVRTFPIFPNLRERLTSNAVRENPDFIDVLLQTSGQQASNNLDYVYALLGHPSAVSEGKLIVEPKYNKTELELLLDVAVALVERTSDLRILAAVRHHWGDLNDYSIPSWLPRWGTQHKSSACSLAAWSWSYNNEYCATKGGPPLFCQFSLDKRQIQIRGFVFDTVDESTETMNFSNDHVSRKSVRSIEKGENWPIGRAFQFKTRVTLSPDERIADIGQTFATGKMVSATVSDELMDFADFRLHLLDQGSTSDKNMRTSIAPEGLPKLQASAVGGTAANFLATIESTCHERKLFSTEKGRLGLGPQLLEKGDLCCIIFGCRIPLILRKEGLRYRLVGETYVHGAVSGEIMVNWDPEICQEQVFEVF